MNEKFNESTMYFSVLERVFKINEGKRVVVNGCDIIDNCAVVRYVKYDGNLKIHMIKAYVFKRIFNRLIPYVLYANCINIEID